MWSGGKGAGLAIAAETEVACGGIVGADSAAVGQGGAMGGNPQAITHSEIRMRRCRGGFYRF